MGNSCVAHSPYQLKHGNSHQLIKQNFLKNHQLLDLGYCKVWKRKIDDKQILEQYKIHIDNKKEYQQCMGMLQIRMNSSYFVNVFHLNMNKEFEQDYKFGLLSENQKPASNYLCTENQFFNAVILTERIPFRLSNLLHIPHEKILLIIKESLVSFKILKQIYGLFIVNSNMIGFSTDNQKMKVWMHTDFSQSKPQNPFCNSISKMLTSIILSIQKYCNRPYDQELFMQFLSEKKNDNYLGSFEQIQKGFNQYVLRNQFKVQDRSLKAYLNGSMPGIGYMSQFQQKIYNALDVKAKYQLLPNSQNNSSQTFMPERTTHINFAIGPNVNKTVENVSNQTSQATIRKINHFNEQNQQKPILQANNPGAFFRRDNLHMMAGSLQESRVSQNHSVHSVKTPKKWKFSFAKFNQQQRISPQSQNSFGNNLKFTIRNEEQIKIPVQRVQLKPSASLKNVYTIRKPMYTPAQILISPRDQYYRGVEKNQNGFFQTHKQIITKPVSNFHYFQPQDSIKADQKFVIRNSVAISPFKFHPK